MTTIVIAMIVIAMIVVAMIALAVAAAPQQEQVMGKRIFSQGDGELLGWSINFNARIGIDPPAYGLTSGQSDQYRVLHDLYAADYQAAIDPITRTRGKVSAKTHSRANLIAAARLLISIINGQSTVSDAMRIDLGLNVRKKPSPRPAPTDRPGMEVVSVVNRTVLVHLHDSASSSRRGKPAGAVAAWVYTFIGDHYPTDPSAWSFYGAFTRASCPIVFPDTLAAGQQVWIRAAWINRKQEMGPLSTPITTNLQGGGSVSQAIKIAA